MSKHHLRKESTCLNCGHPVELRYCSKCGQENVESRQSFGHLVRHFAEDFTHYEGNFWRTIKYLLFRPAYLTRNYLSGKRASYVAPVKLYIFISFAAFFIPHILPEYETEHKEKEQGAQKIGLTLQTYGNKLSVYGDSLQKEASIKKEADTNRFPGFATVEEYDAAQLAIPPQHRDGRLARWFQHKSIGLNKFSREELKQKIAEGMNKNFPKALFIYLPLFAFVIWLMHGKKRWYYFDHGIFTLHYFSFLMLIFTLWNIIIRAIPWHYLVNTFKMNILGMSALVAWVIYYFFRAHRKLYEENRIVSFLKAGLIFTINILLFCILLLVLVTYTMFVTVH
jgi:hypothetical protein